MGFVAREVSAIEQQGKEQSFSLLRRNRRKNDHDLEQLPGF
jgi:hypothetical protein